MSMSAMYSRNRSRMLCSPTSGRPSRDADFRNPLAAEVVGAVPQRERVVEGHLAALDRSADEPFGGRQLDLELPDGKHPGYRVLPVEEVDLAVVLHPEPDLDDCRRFLPAAFSPPRRSPKGERAKTRRSQENFRPGEALREQVLAQRYRFRPAEPKKLLSELAFEANRELLEPFYSRLLELGWVPEAD